VGMWKSRVVCEISKGRWKSFCDFHGPDISAAGPQNQILEQGSTRSTRSRSTSGLLKNQMEVSGLEELFSRLDARRARNAARKKA
jgi:hypothetical protein